MTEIDNTYMTKMGNTHYGYDSTLYQFPIIPLRVLKSIIYPYSTLSGIVSYLFAFIKKVCYSISTLYKESMLFYKYTRR